MRLTSVKITNFRSCKDVSLDLGAMHALVGANNAGKSTILRALDFLFNPSTSKLDDECFWDGQPAEIRVEAIFTQLNAGDRENLASCLRPDGTFRMARTATATGDGVDEEGKFKISQSYCKPVPIYPWLNDAEIKTDTINTWWGEKNALKVRDKSFGEFLGGAKPNVGTWKDKAKQFVEEFLIDTDYEEKWIDNPSGYAGVLKGSLPMFILVPAVREVADESKVTKTGPFGRLLSAVLSTITEEHKEKLAILVEGLNKHLNRSKDGDRLPGISDMETRLTEIISEVMPCDLELEFQAPTLEVLLTTPKLFVDDGFRNVAENKGHGMQRAVIFSILRCYSEHVSGKLGQRTKSVIFAIEEPEIFMHPQAQRTIRRVLRSIAEQGDQVIYSTHSALLVDVAYFDEVIRIEQQTIDVDKRKAVSSIAWQLPMQKMIDDQRCRYPKTKPTEISMRDIYSNAYHPDRAEGFFAKKIILVEGATEEYSLPVYASGLNLELDAANIAVIDCGGKGPMNRLYRVFNELGIPCYPVFDYDKNNKDSKVITQSKELLNLVEMSSEAPENAMVADRAACFSEKWETQIKPEIDDYDSLHLEAAQIFGSGDSKPLISRYIARRLITKNPASVPPTIAAILAKGCQAIWVKSCLRTQKDGDKYDE